MSDANRWDKAYQSVEAVRTWTDREIGSVLHEPLAAWTDCMLFVCQSDELFRQAERAETLAIDAELATSARRRATRLNGFAIQALDVRIPAAFEELRRELRELPLQDFDRPLRTFEDAIHEKLLGLDINRDQTRVVAKRLRHAMETARSAGIPGLCDLLMENRRELSRLRHQRQDHNDPVTAICAAVCAAVAGIIFAVCTANNGGRACSDPMALTFAGLLFGMAVAIMFAQFLLVIGGSFA
jgi:phage tail protein X